jgi:hypothetical protein
MICFAQEFTFPDSVSIEKLEARRQCKAFQKGFTLGCLLARVGGHSVKLWYLLYDDSNCCGDSGSGVFVIAISDLLLAIQ